jgi:hypothetical protein
MLLAPWRRRRMLPLAGLAPGARRRRESPERPQGETQVVYPLPMRRTMVRCSIRAGVLVVLLVGLVERAAAQDCDCDHVLDGSVTVASGIELGVAPGDRVCVMAGDWEFLRLRAIRGLAGAPVTIVNCGGQVRIHNTDRAYALVVEEDSQYFHLTGTGDPEHEYGFRISAPDRDPYPGVGLSLGGRSSDYEVDHLEIFDTGFAGLTAKTDPYCDGTADQDVFVQRNVELHHLYVHDTRGEGFYVGSTQTFGHTLHCDGAEVVRQPHLLEGISIHDNIVEDTGWDGMQVGMAHTGCEVFRNVIRRVGQEGVEYQQQGLQIGGLTSCAVFGNVLEDGPTNGIFVQHAGSVHVYNNLVAGFDGDAIYANHQGTVPGASYRFEHNTLVAYGGHGLRVFGPGLAPSSARNNLVVGASPGIGIGADVSFVEEANLYVANAAAAGFVGGSDRSLVATSVAVGAGVPIAAVAFDLAGYPRPNPPSIGALEYHDPEVEWTPDWPGGGPGGGSGESGCSCAVVGAAAARPGYAPRLVGLLAFCIVPLAARRRARGERSGIARCSRDTASTSSSSSRHA